MNLWRQFWEKSHRIYVNERHKQVHYRQVANDILAVLPPDSNLRVLDYGCGDALEAERVAARVGRLYLFDAAAEVRGRLQARFGATGITVLDDAALAELAPASLDLVVVNSVVQYLDPAEFAALLVMARRLLRPNGILVIADVIPPDAGAVADVVSLLRSALRHGFLGAAVGGLIATFFSDYRRLRRAVGLATYSAPAMQRILTEAGFAAERRPTNFGFNPKRMTFLARRPA